MQEIMNALAAPFAVQDVKFKPQVVSGNRALAVAYVTVRAVMDRLDEVLGVNNWQDEYLFLPDGSCVCTLKVRLGEEWIVKTDVGGESEQSDEGDRRKAAVSDALKRAAVKIGIGRYLYRLPMQWYDYDPQKRMFVKKPTLPQAEQQSIPPPRQEPEKVQVPDSTKVKEPESGEELWTRLTALDARMSADQMIVPGELIKHVLAVAVQKGITEPNIRRWSKKQAVCGFEIARAYSKQKKASAQITDAQLQQLYTAMDERVVDVFETAQRFGVNDVIDLAAAQFNEVLAYILTLPKRPVVGEV